MIKRVALDGNTAGGANPQTPAGQQLITAGVFSLQELEQMGGVMQPLAAAVPDPAGMGWLKTFDLNLSWGYKFRDRLEIRPGIAFYNLFNFANFDGPAAPFSTILDGTQGSPNGTTNPQPNSLRLGLGSGVNALGAPRAIEFTLKVKF